MIDYKLGWVRQPEDDRDLKVSVSRHIKANLPPFVDLSGQLPPCFDQGNLSSCTGNATAAAILFDEAKQRPGITPQTAPIPSRLFLYYQGRSIEGSENEDGGAIIRDVVKAASQTGFVSEELWPYDESKVNVRPSQLATDTAAQHRIKVYRAVPQTSDDIRGCLALGFPVIFGFTVFSNINDTETTGVLTMPGGNDAEEGGHAVVATGYNDAKQTFKVRNSWGTVWSDKGYFQMSQEYLLDRDLASDLWIITSI